ncbi:MAG: LPS assembly lipoprotein LptE [Planctomycetaceae bacterium]|nr:LPS assembly lipoprotein LptE [Planctomycetaceae bacterium]
MKTAYLLLAIPLAALVAAGCTGTGYTMEDQYRPGIKTVAVPVWSRGKDVYRREVEFRMTEAVIKQIELETPYKVVNKLRADTQLTGRIDAISQQVLSYDSKTGAAREIELVITMSFVWTDLRSGKELARNNALSVSGTYIPLSPYTEDFYQGSETVLNKAARMVVEHMAEPW